MEIIMKRAVIKKNIHNEKFVLFFHEYKDNGVCSNWYRSSFKVDGITFDTVEKYMMYQKAILFKDRETANKILLATSPGEIKALGRKVKNFDNKIWDEHKFDIVFTGVFNKFTQNEELKQWLIETDADYFVEASPFDAIWGIKLDASDSRCLDVKQWKGENLLGKAILKARKAIVAQK